MSGLPNAFSPPHGDALLRPGRDYELRGNEIVAVPNRTGGGMTTLREALEKTKGERYCDHEGYDDHCHNCTAWLVKGEVYADLAPIIEKAVRAGYDRGFRDRAVEDPCDNQNGVTAGVAAMVESQ